MRRQTLGVLLAVAVGATLVFGVVGALAKPGNGGNGNVNPQKLANKACHDQKKALKQELGGKLGNKAFKVEWGKRAMRACKRQTTDEVQEDAKNAAHECKAEATDPDFPTEHGGMTFGEFYGTNKPNDNGANGANKNAFGKCVSGKVRAEQAEDLEQLKNAAKECKAERDDTGFADEHEGKSFAEFYGTNRNNKNALGKCVSKKAQEAEEEVTA